MHFQEARSLFNPHASFQLYTIIAINLFGQHALALSSENQSNTLDDTSITSSVTTGYKKDVSAVTELTGATVESVEPRIAVTTSINDPSVNTLVSIIYNHTTTELSQTTTERTENITDSSLFNTQAASSASESTLLETVTTMEEISSAEPSLVLTTAADETSATIGISRESTPSTVMVTTTELQEGSSSTEETLTTLTESVTKTTTESLTESTETTESVNAVDVVESRTLLTEGPSMTPAVSYTVSSSCIPTTETRNDTIASIKLTDRADKGLLIFAGVSTILIIIISAVGNIMTLFVIARTPKLKKTSSYFIVSLCISDMTYSVLDLPFFATRYFFTESSDITTEGLLCTFVPFVQYYTLGVSLFAIGFVSINRFIMVAYCKIYDRLYTKRNTVLMIVGFWTMTFLFCLPTLLGRWGQFGVDTKMQYCSIIEDDNGWSSKYVLIGTGFSLSCLAIIISYSGIFIVVHRSENRMRKHRSLTFSPVANSSDAHGMSEAEKKVTKMILVVFISFLLCYLPNHLVKFVDKKADHPNTQIVSYLLLYMSCGINPFIYAITNTEYRMAYKELLISFSECLCKHRKRSHYDGRRHEAIQMKKRHTTVIMA